MPIGYAADQVIPQHRQTAQAIRDCCHSPHDAMEGRVEVRQWGAYWNDGQVTLTNLAVHEVQPFLADLSSYYADQDGPVYLFIEDRDMENFLGSALAALGCVRNYEQALLAHTGVFPSLDPVPGLSIEQVGHEEATALARTGLQATPNLERSPGSLLETVRRRQRSHRPQLMGTGHGLVARVDDEEAAILQWYDEAHHVWIECLEVHRPAWRQRIEAALLKQCVAMAYSRGFRTVLLSVVLDSWRTLEFYRKLGFLNVVNWQCCYSVEL